MDIDGFRKYLLKQDRAKNTIDSYIFAIKFFFGRYDEITEETVLDYKAWLITQFKPKTVNSRITAVLVYSKYAKLDIKVKGLKLHKALSLENVISQEEFNKLIEGLKTDGNERGYWMVMLLAQTGARVSEFVRLTKSGLQRGYDEMFTKGKVRRIYYPATLIKDSQKFFDKQKSDLLFLNRFGKPISTRGVSQLLKNMAKRYDIRSEVIYPHGFRHLFAKNFLQNGGDLTLLSDLLGHENIGTTAIYTRQSAAEMSSELSRRMGAASPHTEEPSGTPIQHMYLIVLQQEAIKAQREALEFAKLALQLI